MCVSECVCVRVSVCVRALAPLAQSLTSPACKLVLVGPARLTKRYTQHH